MDASRRSADLAIGSWIGFGVSLAHQIAKDMGSEVAFVENDL